MTSELRSADLDWLAEALETHYRAKGYTVTRNQALWDGAPLVAFRVRKRSEDLLLELRQKADFPHYLEPFVQEAVAKEEPGALSVVIAKQPDGDDDGPSQVSLRSLQRMRALGVGLIEFGPEGPTVVERSVPFSLRIAVPPGLKRDTKVPEIAAKFNRGDALDALRDLVVHVEGRVRDIADRAARRGVVNVTLAEAAALDLSRALDMLATPKYRNQPQHQVITVSQKADLHSFRTARNLAQHPVRTRAQRAALHRQLKERMATGFRLCEELRAIRVPRARTVAPFVGQP